MALQEHGNADFGGFKVVRARIVEGVDGHAHPNGGIRNPTFLVVLRTSLLPWGVIERRRLFRQRHCYESPFLDGRLTAWLNTLYTFASGDGIGSAASIVALGHSQQ